MSDDASSTESPSVGRWRRRATRGLDMAKGAGNLAAGWWRALGRHMSTAQQKLGSFAQRLESAAAPYPLPPPLGRLTERREASGPIAVPARGYVFHFNLRAIFTWSSEGLRPELLSWHAQYFMPQAEERLRRLAADPARNLAPHQAGVLEVKLQRLLAEQAPWRYERGEVVVTCQPDAWVRLDERVRRALLPYWEQLAKLECEYDAHMWRAQHAERLCRKWVTILQEHVESPVVDGDPTTNADMVDALRRMMAMQKAAAQWVEDLLGERRNGHPF